MTAIVAPGRFARLGWLPRQAKSSLDGGWRRTWSKCKWPWNDNSNKRLPTTSRLHFLALHNLYSGPFQTRVVHRCRKVVILAQTPLLCYYDCNGGTCAISKTRVASKTSKTITGWWLTSDVKQMPLAIKFQINYQKRDTSQIKHKAELQWES